MLARATKVVISGVGRCAVVCAVLGPILGNNGICGQAGSVRNLSSPTPQETYSIVMDLLFPREDSDPSKVVYELVLRFQPSFHYTSQIVIRRRTDKLEVIEHKADVNVYNEVNRILGRSTESEDPVKIAKSISVTRREVNVPNPEIARWYKSFFKAMSESTKTLSEKGMEFDRTNGKETVILDGTLYKLWYRNLLDELSFTLYDEEPAAPGSRSATGSVELVRWMNTIRSEISKFPVNEAHGLR